MLFIDGNNSFHLLKIEIINQRNNISSNLIISYRILVLAVYGAIEYSGNSAIFLMFELNWPISWSNLVIFCSYLLYMSENNFEYFIIFILF